MTHSRGLVKAMSITGSTQAIKIVLSIVRQKVIALLLGPAGVGVFSIYNNLQTTASTLAGLGLGNSGVRQIAQARGDATELGRVRNVMLTANLVHGLIAMTVIWLLREPIARWLFDDSDYGFAVGIVGASVLLNLLTGSQTALLRGMRKVGDIGRITVWSAVAGTVTGLAAIWLLGEEGLLWLVVLQPLTAVLVAGRYTRRLPKSKIGRLSLGQIWNIWKPMVQLGGVFMLGGLATTSTLLLVRGHIASAAGLDAVGQFSAAWGITMTYVGFLLNAMALDYYPRLAEVIHEREATDRLINDQTQLGMAIAGPVLLLLIGVAPFVIALLYSDRFGAAVPILQWQTVGNVLKVASWSLSFALIAASRSMSYLIVQVTFNVVFVSGVLLGLPLIGLEATGVAFVGAYACYFAICWHMVARTGFRWERRSIRLILTYTVAAFGLMLLALTSPLAAALLAIGLSLVGGFVGGHIVMEMVGPSRKLAPISRFYAACRWPIREAE